MGRRAFQRTVNQAGIGRVRPTLAYKQLGGRALVVADRWFASSKTHHGCGGYRLTSSSATGVGLPQVWAAGGPQRQRGVEPP